VSLLHGIMIILCKDWTGLPYLPLYWPYLLCGRNLMAEQPSPAMTVRDVAGFLAVDEKTIYRLAQQGKLPGFKVAGTWRFQLQDIQAWIEKQKRRTRTKERATN